MNEVLEKNIRYTFRDPFLLRTALTHTSYINEHQEPYNKCNERLEFFGDSILEQVSSEFLFHKYPDEPEGKLTNRRASLVCEKSLAKAARKIHLGDFLRLGNGCIKENGRDSDNILSDAMEALIAAVYLDGGIQESKELIRTTILSQENEVFQEDGKTALQEMVQEKGHTVLYKEIRESGPDHLKTFEYQVLVQNQVCGSGTGHSKKEAQNNAALEAIQNIRSGKLCI